MKIFALSDTHLSFASDKPMDIFGDAWKNHANRIKESWTEIVSDEDLVIVPGDISWALKPEDALPDLYWLSRLPGRKILLKGNHDLWWYSISRLNTMFPDNMIFLQNNSFNLNTVGICGSRGWNIPISSQDWSAHDEKIYRRELIRLEMSLKTVSDSAETIIAAMHYPPTDNRGRETEFTKLFEKYNVNQVIYGHIHGTDALKHAYNGVINGISYKLVSCDNINFKPVLLTEV